MVENRVYKSNVLQITKNDGNDLKWTKISSSNLKKNAFEKNLWKKRKKKKICQIGADLNPGPTGYEPLTLPQSYRCYDMKMLKIDDFILTLPN